MLARTIFLAEDKDEVSGTVLDICIQMCHETDQATLHGGALLWPMWDVCKGRQDLMTRDILELWFTVNNNNLKNKNWNSMQKNWGNLWHKLFYALFEVLTCFLMYCRVSRWALQLSVSRLRIGVSLSLIFSPWKWKKQAWFPLDIYLARLHNIHAFLLPSPTPGVSP